ncbi:hypothetical protein AAHA92_11465 [Salvia divinorum]|uniref:Uncharacterized protein n=1 Tax=Salvia divinorum TaxID=28513 RepID=A0ABD1HHX8_SALDI
MQLISGFAFIQKPTQYQPTDIHIKFFKKIREKNKKKSHRKAAGLYTLRRRAYLRRQHQILTFSNSATLETYHLNPLKKLSKFSEGFVVSQ